MDWIILDNPESVAVAVCDHVLKSADRAIKLRDTFHLVLAGGSTPQRCYELLAEQPCDWAKWHIWFGDERCLPQGDPSRNNFMVDRAFTGKVTIPGSQIHLIEPGGDPEIVARNYAKDISQHLPFDLVILGVGDDGHTASLFPGKEGGSDELVITVQNAPKPPAERISLNYSALENTRETLFLVTGKAKYEVLERWYKGDLFPASRLKIADKSVIYTDQRLSQAKY